MRTAIGQEPDVRIVVLSKNVESCSAAFATGAHGRGRGSLNPQSNREAKFTVLRRIARPADDKVETVSCSTLKVFPV